MSVLSDLTGTTGFLERNPAIDTGLKATGIGAGAYATLALVREFLDAFEDRKAEKRRRTPSIGKDTIVVTLPNTVKGASAREAVLEYAKVHRKPLGDEDPKSKVRQARNADGTFARGYDVTFAKSAQDVPADKWYFGEVGDKIVDWSAGIGGLGAGWMLMQKVHDYLKQKRLKREISAAQKEYIDLLSPEKAAAYVPDYSGMGEAPRAPNMIERAVTPTGSLREGSQDMLAAGGTLAVLLAAASSIITKKWMDDRFKDPESAQNKTKVKNIVFKSASGDPLECDAVDVLAYAKVASIAMGLPTEKSAQFVAPEMQRTAYDNMYKDPYDAVRRVFSGLGLSGEDPLKWKYRENPDFGTFGRHKIAWHPFTSDASEAQREAFQNAFMDPKFAKQREFLAQQAINQYLDGFNNSGFGKSWFGQLLSPLLNWLGGGVARFMGNTEWGAKKIFNAMQGKVRDVQNPSKAVQQAPVAGVPKEQLINPTATPSVPTTGASGAHTQAVSDAIERKADKEAIPSQRVQYTPTSGPVPLPSTPEEALKAQRDEMYSNAPGYGR